jgi:16S rRNA (cytosine1402-N4)-methyltransferase
MDERPHIPVLLDEVIDALRPSAPEVRRVIDGTLGAGGHARALLAAGVDEVLGLDVDPQALALAGESLRSFGDRAHLVHASYTSMQAQARKLGWDMVDGILLDVGVSSMQLDTPERGFAFMQEGPLDMRFDPSGDRPPASDIVNHWDERDLSNLLRRYSDERYSRRIAQAIIAARPLTTTRDLAAVVESAIPQAGRSGGIHPATRTFQALRIAVNDELGRIETVLPLAIDLLRPGGRLAVISFHSLEDRIVKQHFKHASTEVKSPPGMVLENEREAIVRLVTRKPIMASDAECERNPRSRSARLRVVEKV